MTFKHPVATLTALLVSTFAISPSNSFPVLLIGLCSTAGLHKAQTEREEIKDRADRQLAYFNNLHSCVHKP